MDHLLLFAHVSSSSALIPLAIGIWQWKYLEKDLKLLVWIVVASVVSDAASLILLGYSINTWTIVNLFFIVQFILLFLVLGQHKRIWLLKLSFYGCVAFAALNYTFFQTPLKFNSYTAYFGGIIIIMAALNYLYQLLYDKPVDKIQKLPLFWIAFGVLVYYGGTLFLFLFNNYLIAHQPEDHQSIWILHNLLNIIKNIFLFVALWLNFNSRIYSP